MISFVLTESSDKILNHKVMTTWISLSTSIFVEKLYFFLKLRVKSFFFLHIVSKTKKTLYCLVVKRFKCCSRCWYLLFYVLYRYHHPLHRGPNKQISAFLLLPHRTHTHTHICFKSRFFPSSQRRWRRFFFAYFLRALFTSLYMGVFLKTEAVST